MDGVDMFGPGIAEICYLPGCEEWITGSSDYCSPEHEKTAKLIQSVEIEQRIARNTVPVDTTVRVL